MFSGAAVLLSAGTVTALPGVASASFGGTANGDIDFSVSCNSNGQQIWSVSDQTTSATCTSGQTAQTAGSTDAMPYFNSTGSTLNFSSNRGGGY
jgi:hypothetical protein